MEADEPHSRAAFFYGTLMAPSVLARVTGREIPRSVGQNTRSVRPALLRDYQRHRVKHADYPAIVPCDGSLVRGTFVDGLTAKDIWRLDIFEGPEYERREVYVELADNSETKVGSAKVVHEGDDGVDGIDQAQCAVHQRQIVKCETYVWKSGSDGMLEQSEWDFEEFVRERLWRWAPSSDEYRELDDAVNDGTIREGSGTSSADPTGGRAFGGQFESVVQGK